MKYIAITTLMFLGLFNAGCSETAQGDTKESVKTSFTCEIEMSEVKWFWGEVCPIGQKEKWVSVGHSYAQNNKTTGCVQLKNVCSMTR